MAIATCIDGADPANTMINKHGHYISSYINTSINISVEFKISFFWKISAANHVCVGVVCVYACVRASRIRKE